MTSIIGISAFFHDSAASLIIDGKIIGAVQEERFSRIKHDANFPTKSIEYLLKEADLKQGQESRRESISNSKTYTNTLRLSADEIKKYFNTTEILNKESLPLRQEYKEKVQSYFKKSND